MAEQPAVGRASGGWPHDIVWPRVGIGTDVHAFAAAEQVTDALLPGSAESVTVSGPYICTAMLCSEPLRSAKVMCLSTTSPSIWWNIGEWVASTSSLR